MKNRVFSVLIVIAVILILSLLSAFAVELPDVDYFMVILKPAQTLPVESIIANFTCDAVEKIEIISDPSEIGSDGYQAILLVYVKDSREENIASVYEYFKKHEAVYFVSPDYDLILKRTEEENELQKISRLMPYDVNGDFCVSAADARAVLRASVGIESLTPPEKRAAGVNENISASDARKILRASVGLEKVPEFTVELEKFGEEFVIGPLDCQGAAGFFWECGGDTEKFTVTEKIYGAETLDIGGAVRYYYIFTPKEKGAFTLKFTYNDIKVPETVNEFTLKVHHMVKVCVLPGPDDEIWKKNFDL